MIKLPKRISVGEFVLRVPSYSDAPQLFENFFSDINTMLDVSAPRHSNVEDSYEVVMRSHRGWREGTVFSWVIEHEPSGLISGFLDATVVGPGVELGSMIAKPGPARRRRGSLEAMRGLLLELQAAPEVHRIAALCAVDGRAHHAMSRLGFQCEGVARNARAQPNRGRPAVDHFVYAMSRRIPTEVRQYADGSQSIELESLTVLQR